MTAIQKDLQGVAIMINLSGGGNNPRNNFMVDNALASCVARPSAAMVLTMYDIHQEGFDYLCNFEKK